MDAKQLSKSGAVIRDSNGRIVSGNVNPNGWSRVHKIRKALNRAITTEKLTRILNELCRLAEGGKQTQIIDGKPVEIIVPGDIDAIREVLNRAYGKSTEHIEINQESHLVINVRQMSDVELKESITMKMKQLESTDYKVQGDEEFL